MLLYPQFLQECEHGPPNQPHFALGVTLPTAPCNLVTIYTRPCLKLCDASFPLRGVIGRLSNYIIELLADTSEPCSYLRQLLRDQSMDRRSQANGVGRTSSRPARILVRGERGSAMICAILSGITLSRYDD